MPYIAICKPDGHRIFAKTQLELDGAVARYAEEHGYAESEFRKFRIPRATYELYKAKRDDPLWWILHQGDAMKELSPGQKELIARNIPKGPTPKARGHRNRDYLRVLAMKRINRFYRACGPPSISPYARRGWAGRR